MTARKGHNSTNIKGTFRYKRPYITTKDHTRPHKATAIQCHNKPQKIKLCLKRVLKKFSWLFNLIGKIFGPCAHIFYSLALFCFIWNLFIFFASPKENYKNNRAFFGILSIARGQKVLFPPVNSWQKHPILRTLNSMSVQNISIIARFCPRINKIS